MLRKWGLVGAYVLLTTHAAIATDRVQGGPADTPAAIAASTAAAATPTLVGPGAQRLPSLAELQAAGAVIGEIRIKTLNIFDTTDPRERGLLYRLANQLHIQTRPGVIEPSLLFKRGEPLLVQRVNETERVLRTNPFLYDVSIQPVAYQNGIVDLEVKTYDTWSLNASANVSRSGGANTTGLTFQEKNFLGSGLSIGLSSSSNPDRKGTEFDLSHRHALGNWEEIDYKRARYDNGSGQAFSFKRPFYALDTRWAAGISTSSDNNLVSAYGNGGALVDQYRFKQNKTEVFRGWSDGLVDGWVRRYTLGLVYQEDRYRAAPGFTSPMLPTDQRLVTPYVRLEVVQDRIEKLTNRDLIGRAEFFATGLAAQLQVGRSFTALGSSRNLWDYQGTVSNGYVLAGNQLLASAGLKGQYGDGQNQHQTLGLAAKYYVTHTDHARMYASAATSVTRSNDSVDQLQLGGDNGLRGYPLRYQSGQRRSLLTLEERFYSDLFLLRLFRVGGAVFYDTGRAWGGANPNPVNPGWLSDAGFGLRIFSVRSARSQVLHLDFAFPLQRDPGIKPFQVLLQTKLSF
jgi:outer membrane protein assembly factor BamA